MPSVVEYKMNLFTLEIDGRALAAFSVAADQSAQEADRAARELVASDWLTEDLNYLLHDGKPLWNGTSDRSARPATPEEASVWRASFAAAQAAADEDSRPPNMSEPWFVWLVPITDPAFDGDIDDE
jgi:hypothetical protein